MKAAPSATRQVVLDWAVALTDEVMRIALRHNVSVSVAVVDPGGDPVQQDRMDGSPVAGADVALAVAATSARFGESSQELQRVFGPATALLGGLAPAPFCPAPGGVPLLSGGRLVGGLGVGGADPSLCRDIAEEALR